MSVADLIARETQRYIEAHPKAAAEAVRLKEHWLFGAPFHWMNDWATPSAMIAEDVEGAVLTDIDDNTYDDFCLGDTPGMFGHGRPEIARAIAGQSRRGGTPPCPATACMEPTLRGRDLRQALGGRTHVPGNRA